MYVIQSGPCLARERFWFSAVRHPFEHLASAYYQLIGFLQAKKRKLGRYEMSSKVYE